jgi:elongation factor 1 alpha-like protein
LTGSKAVAPKTKSSADTDGTATDVAALRMSDVPKPKSKNLNVLEEFQKSSLKNAASFVVVGE